MKAKNRVFAGILAAVMLLICFPFSAFAAVNGAISVAAVSGEVGENVSLQVSITNNPGIVSATFNVDYNHNALKLNSITDGGLLGAQMHNVDGVNDAITWSNLVAPSNYTATGVVATLNFTVLSGASVGLNAVSLSYTSLNVINYNLEPVPFTVTAGGVNVSSTLTAPVINNYINLSDSLAMVYEYNRSDLDALNASKVFYSFNGTDYSDTPLFDSGSDYKAAVIPAMAAKNIGDDIYVKVENTSTPDVYSIAKACKSVIERASMFSDTMVRLAKSILNYGKAAQEYFKYNLDKPICDEYYSLDHSDPFVTYEHGDPTGKDVKILGTSIILKDKLTIKFWMTVENLDPTDLTVKINGKDTSLKLVPNKEYYTVSYNLSYLDIAKMVQIQVANGDEIVSNTYMDSVASYCASASDALSTNTVLVNLCDNIVAYVECIEDHFDDPETVTEYNYNDNSDTEIIIKTDVDGAVYSKYEAPDFNPFDSAKFTAKEDPTRFETKVSEYEDEGIKKSKVMFYGSTLFAEWSDIEDVIVDTNGNKATFNHSLSGATLYDLCYYYKRLVNPNAPKVIVLNSFAEDKAAGYTNDEIITLTAWLCKNLRKDLPNVKIYITDVAPTKGSKSAAQISGYNALNKLLSDYADNYKDTFVIELSKDPVYYTDEQYCGTYTNLNSGNFVADAQLTNAAYTEFAVNMNKYLSDVLFVGSKYDDLDFDPLDPAQFTPKDDPTQFESAIKKYEKAGVQKGKMVFYGSSLFTRWTPTFGSYNNPNLEDEIYTSTGKKIALNHGFGSSTMFDLCYFYERMVKAYEPSVLVITSFLNDLTAGYTNDEMMKLTAWLCNQARNDMPGIRFYITDFRPTKGDKTASEVNRRKDFNNKLLEYASVYDDVTVLELSKDPIYYTDPIYCGTYTHINNDNLVDNVHFTRDAYFEFGKLMREKYLRDELYEDLGYTPDDIEFKSTYNLNHQLDASVKKLADAYSPDKEGKIVFYGNSHYTRWTTAYDNNSTYPNDAPKMNLEDQIVGPSGEKMCINHGYGSSTLHDLCYSYDDLVLKFKPKALVVTTYVNDTNYTVQEILKLAEWLIQKATWDIPGIQIFFTDYPPVARDRSSLMTWITGINNGLKQLEAKYDSLTIIELSKDARFYDEPQYAGTYTHQKQELSVEGIHFTPNGYAILADIYKTTLINAGLLK